MCGVVQSFLVLEHVTFNKLSDITQMETGQTPASVVSHDNEQRQCVYTSCRPDFQSAVKEHELSGPCR